MSRFLDELIAYVGFDAGDRARLRALHPKLIPHLPTIAARFYETAARSPGASSVLRGPEQIARLQCTLVDWMASGLLGPHDAQFYDKRSRIGRRHVEIGLGSQYMFVGMNVVRLAYHELIETLCEPAEVPPMLRAVNKLLDIELAIMVRHYQLDSEERLLARERKIQADRISAMQTMTAGIAHEVRNPLNSAQLQLELLQRRLKRTGDPKLVEPCELARNEVARLTELVDDFLAFARPPELRLRDHDVVEILQHVAQLERVTAERRGAELALVTERKPVVAHVDGAKIHQVVLNLVRNAIEAVDRGGHVAIELEDRGEQVEIRVRDDGPGMSDEVRERIYEPFFSTKESGTGLGMSIVHSLVALHGGTIDVETSASGTCFGVAIPRRI